MALAALGAILLAACGPLAERGAPSPTQPSTSGRPAPLVDPRQIVPGGPPPDGIPPIDHPKFLAPEGVDLSPQEPVLSILLHGEAKAYPVRILMWHEIVNDRVGGVPVTVTYCPLCNTGIGFRRPVEGGKLLDFGTSGKLYNSNLVMYDRQTESLWPQALGQAVIGPLTGTKLRFIPLQLLSWQDWKAAHPDGLVLSTDTGYSRAYGANPYVGYDDQPRPFLYDQETDPRLPAKEHVLGVVTGDETATFPFTELERRAREGWAAVTTAVGGRPVVVFWKRGTVSALDASSIPDSQDVGAAVAFSPVVRGRAVSFTATDEGITDRETGSRWTIEGVAAAGPLRGTRLHRVLSIDSFWFDWAAFHPETTIFGK